MLKLGCIAGLVATAAAADFTWRGSPASFDSTDLWSGGSPLDVQPPAYTVFGATGRNTVASVPFRTDRQAYQLGQKIELRGANAKIFLGSGLPNQRTVLQLSGYASSVGRNVATFAPTELDSGSNLGGSNVDWGCHLNWEVQGDIASSTPSGSDKAILPRESMDTAYIINIPQNSQIDGIYASNGFTPVQASITGGCSTPRDEVTRNAPMVTLNYQPNCINAMTFGGSSPSSSTCSDFVNRTSGGDNYQAYVSGPRACQVYKVLPNGRLENATADFPDCVEDSNGEVSFPDLASTDASASSEDKSSGSTIIIIVVVAALIIIGIIIAVVVIKVKKDTEQGMRDAGTVSFENPMYDDNGMPDEGDTSGMYDQPDMGSSGYMDVPASGGTSSGYMDVAPEAEGGASGYMDVSPNAEDDAFGQADEDDEDI